MLHQLDEHAEVAEMAGSCTHLTNVIFCCCCWACLHRYSSVDRNSARESRKTKKRTKKLWTETKTMLRGGWTNCKAISNPNIWRYLNRRNRIASKMYETNVTNTLWPLRNRERISKWLICRHAHTALCVRVGGSKLCVAAIESNRGQKRREEKTELTCAKSGKCKTDPRTPTNTRQRATKRHT